MPKPPPDPVSFRRQGTTLVATIPSDSLVKAGDVDRICGQIDDAIAQAPDGTSLLITFVNVRYMSSMFLGRLMGFQKRVTHKNGTLMLADLNSHLADVLRLAKLDQYVTIYPTTSAALAGRTPTWTALMASGSLSALIGLVCLVRLIKGSGPAKAGAQLAQGYLIASILLPGLIFAFRHRLARTAAKFQWVAVGVILFIVAAAASGYFLGG